MGWTNITKPSAGQPLDVVAFGGAVVDDLNYLYNQLGGNGSGVTLTNPSFETDTDGNNATVDGWTTTAFTGGSLARSLAQSHHGQYSLAITSPGGAGNGGGSATNQAFIPTNAGRVTIADFWALATASGMYNKAEIVFYSADKSTVVSTVSVWDSLASGSPTAWTKIRGAALAPAGAYWSTLKLTGAPNDGVHLTAGTVYFDGITYGEQISTNVISLAANNSSPLSRLFSTYICTGTADDVTINAALTLAGATGASVFLAAGTYQITATLNVPSNVMVYGEGQSTLLQWSGVTQTIVSLSSVSYVTLRDFKIDGTPTSGTTGAGIYINNSSSVIVENVNITNVNASAGFSYAALQIAGTSSDVIVENCRVYNNGGNGLGITSVTVANIMVRSSVFSGNGMGIYSIGSLVTVAQNRITANTTNGIELNGAADTLVVGNRIDSNQYHGIYCYNTDNTPHKVRIDGNDINGNSQVLDNSYDGICIDGFNSSTQMNRGVYITGNTIARGGGAKQQRYGINFTANSLYCEAYRNDVYQGGKTADVYNAGTGCINESIYIVNDASLSTASATYVTMYTAAPNLSEGVWEIVFAYTISEDTLNAVFAGRILDPSSVTITSSGIQDKEYVASGQRVVSGIHELTVSSAGVQNLPLQACVVSGGGNTYVAGYRIRIRRKQ